MGYVYQEFPKTLYRKGADGFVVGCTFACAEDVEAGWVELTAISDAVFKPEEAPAPPVPEAQAPKLKDSADLLQVELDAANLEIAALRELVGSYRAFVAEVAGADELGAIKAKAADLSGAASPPAEKPKRKAKA